MKHVVFILAFIFSVNLSAQNNEKKYAKELNEYFTALTNLGKFNGNVLVSQNGHILLDQSYNIPGKAVELNVSKKSTFIIASVSKIFIKYGILKLAEQGKIKLSDRLNTFIPDFPNGNKISVEHLLYHQSGLPREIKEYEKYESLSLEKSIELAKSEALQFEPGTSTLYSNVGYFILHYIIEKSSEKGYQHFIDNEIIKKYQLENTGEFNSARSVSNFAYGFYNEEGKTLPISQASINRFETGNYYSTTADLYAFSKKLLSGEHMKKEQALKMFKDGLIIQAGGRPGYRAYYYQNLRSNVTFIFTANFSDMPFQKVTDDIISLLEGKTYTVPKEINKKAITVSEDILKQYIGQFTLDVDKSQTFTVTLENHFLYITDKEGEKTKIYPESQTSFFDTPDSEDGYIFSSKSDGTYDLTIISTGLTLKTTRTK
ncbi:serine hydrolase [Chryseobacterium sp. OSA05B]|uniref:serine hydrolase domain-containing protein n=1 Tax=Chryseobacterium sp. OSA05B TaxID=2862650 RepID=UPI001CC0DEBA|nr:serine hydrolase domain-containing protein [Chryseobacterium sp. OSA05B]